MKEDLYDDLLNEKEEKTDFQALFFKYIIHWPWFVASVLICTGLAFAYLRYQIPVYEVSSSILIKEDDKKSTNNALSAMQDFGMLSMTSNFDNEAGNSEIKDTHQESRVTSEPLYQHRHRTIFRLRCSTLQKLPS